MGIVVDAGPPTAGEPAAEAGQGPAFQIRKIEISDLIAVHRPGSP